MKRRLKWQALKVLFWLGPCLVLMGLSAGLVSGSWSPIPASLIGLGSLILVLGVLVEIKAVPNFWGQRSTQVGTNALVATLAVLLILGMLNFLSVRYGSRWDLTENQLFTLAPQSQQVVRNLKRPVRAVVFLPEPDGALRSLLDSYQRQNAQFSFEFVNPQAQPQLAEQFKVQEVGDVFLEAGDRRQLVVNLQRGRLTESRLTNGLEQILSDRQLKVYFLQGHGEQALQPGQRGYAEAAAALGEKFLSVQPLNLAQQATIPTDAAALIVAGPQQPLLEGEVKALTDYLNRGGSLLLLVDPNTDPGLTPLLQEWGITLENRIAINASQQQVPRLGPAASVVSQYGEHPITQSFGNRFSIFPVARPITVKAVKGIQQTPLLLTSDKSWAEADLKNQKLEFNPDKGDQPGPLVLGVAMNRPAPNAPAAPAGQTPPQSRLVVLGNSTFAADGFFSQQLNGDVLLNSISWLSQQSDTVLSIRPKQLTNRRLIMAQWQSNLIYLLAVGILPILGFTIAGLIWWKRR